MTFQLSKNVKGVLSIISAIIINIICGSLYSWPGINGYYISYLKYSDSPSIEIKDGYFFMPLIRNYLHLVLPFLYQYSQIEHSFRQKNYFQINYLNYYYNL